MEINYIADGKFEIKKTETITKTSLKSTTDIENELADLEGQKIRIQEEIDNLSGLLGQVNEKSKEKEVKDKMEAEKKPISKIPDEF